MGAVSEVSKVKQRFAATFEANINRAQNKRLADRLADKELTSAEVGTLETNVNTTIEALDNIKLIAEIEDGTAAAEYGERVCRYGAQQWQFGYNEGDENGWYDGYDVGRSDGYLDGYKDGEIDGKDIGKQETSVAWWNMIVRNTYHTFRNMDFSLVGGFNPPFQFKPSGDVSYMFHGAKNIGVITADEIDFSEATNMYAAFDWSSGISEIELMDLRKVTNFTYMLCNNYSITKIGKLILKEDGTQNVTASTFQAHWLKEIRIEGKFGSNVFFEWCTGLTYESLMSIINALYDFSATSETRTLKLSSASITQLYNEDKALIYNKGWSLVDKDGNTIT